MPIIHQCEQYSEEWDMLRLGKATASQFSKIITPGMKKSEQFKDYAYNLIAEIFMKRPVDTYKSEHMEYGSQLEPEAANYYAFKKDAELTRVGFISDNKNLIGCSPDRLVDNNGLLEIKCPKPNTMIRYFIEQNIEDKYKPQIQGQLFITEREFVDIISYHPELLDTNIIMRVYRDDTYCKVLEKYLSEFHDFMNDCLVKVGKIRPEILGKKRDMVEELLNG